MNSVTAGSPHVGIFDSGVGGLSVLRSVRAALPGVPLSYLADNRHLPYGDKPLDWLTARCATLTAQLLDAGATLILVACNTATTQTIAALRARWPSVAFVGIEPGIKPAVAVSRNRRIGVMATPATVSSVRLKQLIERHAGNCHVAPLPCPGLATAIEAADDAEVSRLLDSACYALQSENVDTVVLGCTHYPLIADRLAARLGPHVQLVDTAEAVSRRVRSLLPTVTAERATAITVIMTGEAAPIERALRRWIREPVMLQQRNW